MAKRLSNKPVFRKVIRKGGAPKKVETEELEIVFTPEEDKNEQLEKINKIKKRLEKI